MRYMKIDVTTGEAKQKENDPNFYLSQSSACNSISGPTFLQEQEQRLWQEGHTKPQNKEFSYKKKKPKLKNIV